MPSEPPPPKPVDTTHPLLALVMIVKDEAHTLPNTLLPLKPYLDAYYVLDTGSTDGTQDVLRKTLDNIPGKIFEVCSTIQQLTSCHRVLVFEPHPSLPGRLLPPGNVLLA